MAPHLLSGENFSFIRQQSNQSVNEYVYLTFVLVLYSAYLPYVMGFGRR